MRQEPPSSANLEYIENIWEQYLKDPESVGQDWRAYFESMEPQSQEPERARPSIVIGREQLRQGYGPGGKVCAGCGRAAAMSLLQFNVSQLIRNYRVRGHLIAHINPLSDDRDRTLPELTPSYYGMSDDDLELIFNAGHMSPNKPLKLRDIIQNLKETYCGAIGAQFMHIDSMRAREWLQSRMEESRNRISLSKEQQVRTLEKLTDAVVFERFLQKKFVGSKSFSLEGAETLIPLLDQAIEKAGEQGIDNIVIGMPHRGRLNVLANIMGKHPRAIFGEFKDQEAEKFIGRGDVKYHMGFQRTWMTETGKRIHVDLAFNPSHLEFVGPVAQGALKARQVRHNDAKGEHGLLILIHGDAAMAGEGIVQETLNMSELEPFSVGGTLHIVVNNQIGFTTLPEEGRSTTYASDVAKMLQGPIFHVDGEKPDAVAQCLDVCLDYRQTFRRDTVIDLYCYRRRGHNEGDEPTFTQPLMYKNIRQRPDVMTRYTEHLLALKGLTREEAKQIYDSRVKYLEEEYDKTEDKPSPTGKDIANIFFASGQPFRGGMDNEIPEVPTGVPAETLRDLMTRLTTVPEGFSVNQKIKKIMETRLAMTHGERPLDWGCAETLAYASLTTEQIPIRLSGQDAQRGTFSHRHAVLHDTENGSAYMPLGNLAPNQGRVDIVNSPLTEGGVLGFEYGYSTAHPKTLVIWEAQFGDFANVAQVYIDQFISSGEAKWQILSGLVLLLPHGLEGTGPEHASARLERFLASAALDNYLVVNPTTPAQIFHLLRRQAKRSIRKPLIVMSPKSMLRNPRAVSDIGRLADGAFQKIIPDDVVAPEKAKHIILCTGKIYYDLVAKREAARDNQTAIVRIEQLYPLLPETLIATIDAYPKGIPISWVQEEPLNMGAAPFVRLKFEPHLRDRWRFDAIGRPESASPATGSAASHKIEQELIVERAFDRGRG